MALISKAVRNLLGGVSQQPDAMRLDNQCEVQDNAYTSIYDGLTKRPPTEHVKNIYDAAASPALDLTKSADTFFTHIINRSPSEQYVVTVQSDNSAAVIQVHTLDGTVKTVATPDTTAYLQMAEATDKANNSLRAITIADYTFFVNTTKEPTLTADVDATVYEGMLFVKRADADTEYSGTVNSTAITYTTDTTGTNVQTTKIAEELYNDLSGSSGLTRTLIGSTVYFSKASDFTVTVSDDVGGDGLIAIKDEVQRITDLPLEGKDGFRVKIKGDPTDTRDDYWVKFVADNGVSGSGHWEETRARNVKYKYTASLMPHVLIRQADGNFIFAACDGGTYTVDGTDYTLPVWGERNCGDDVSNVAPSFIEKKINDIFLFKNRLCFLADESVIMSETGEFFNHWRTSVTAVLDTDPIDVSTTDASVSILKAATPFANTLILFSDKTQFLLQSAGALSPSTVSMVKTTNFEALSNSRPVTVGNSIYFGFDRGSYSGVRQYFVSGDTETIFDSSDVSSQIPQYIKGSIRQMEGSSHEDIVFVLTDDDRSKLYVYKYHDTARERAVSAWGRFTFPTDTTVLSMGFVGTTLYLISRRSDGVYIDKMRLETGLVDDAFTSGGATITPNYRTLLDRRIDQATTGVSLSGDGLTITLPYKTYTGSTMQVITKKGERIPVVTQNNASNTIVVGSSLTGVDFWAGEQYEMLYRASDVVLRDPSTTGSSRIAADARTQVRYLTIGFGLTGYFKVEVTPDYRDTSTHSFTGRLLGSGNNTIGGIPLEEGTYRVPIYSAADQVQVDIKNDTPLPTALIDLEYELSVNSRANRYS